MSSARWFYSADDQPRGPVPLEQLLEQLRSGQISPTSLVWRQGMDEWTRADAVPEIVQQLRPGSPGGAAAKAGAAEATGARPKAPVPPDSTGASETPKEAPPTRVEARAAPSAPPPTIAVAPAPSAVPRAGGGAKPAPAKAPASGVEKKPASRAAAPSGAEKRPEPKVAPPAGAGAAAPPADAPRAAEAAPADLENPFIAKLREAYALNSRVFAQLAEELRKEGDLEGAIRVCREGLKKHPGYIMARVTMGRALTERGDLASARSVLEPVVAAQPESALARRALGECLERMGRTEEALEQYRSGLAMDPDNDWLRDRISSASAPAPQKQAAGEASAAEPPSSEDVGATAEPQAEVGAEPARVDEEAAWERRGPDEDLPPIPLVDAEESFELENPYDIPTVWKDEAPPAHPAGATSAPGVEKATGSAGSASAKAQDWPLHPLEDLTLPELLQQLHERGFTGVLALLREGVEKTLRFEEGRIVFATTSDPDERMGELLVTRGRITLEQYEKGSQAVRERRVRLGEALVDLEAIGPYQQVEVVTDHIRAITFGLFRWVDGSYQLREGLLEAHEAITLEMTLPEVVLGGIRGIDAWSRVVRGVGGLDARYLPASDLESRLGPLTLSPQQRALLEFKEPQPAGALCRESALADFDVLKTLWAFRVAGILTRLPADPSA